MPSPLRSATAKMAVGVPGAAAPHQFVRFVCPLLLFDALGPGAKVPLPCENCTIVLEPERQTKSANPSPLTSATLKSEVGAPGAAPVHQVPRPVAPFVPPGPGLKVPFPSESCTYVVVPSRHTKSLFPS